MWLTQSLTPKGAKNKALELAVAVDGRPYLFRAYCPDNYRQVWARVGDDEAEALAAAWRPPFERQRVGNWFKLVDHDSAWREGFRVSQRKLPHVGDDPTIYLKGLRWGDLPPATGPYGSREVGEQLAPLPQQLDLFDAVSLYDLMVRLVHLAYQPGDSLTLRFKGVSPKQNTVERIVVPTDGDWLVARPGPKWEAHAKRVLPAPDALHAAMGKQEWRLGSVDQRRPGATLL